MRAAAAMMGSVLILSACEAVPDLAFVSDDASHESAASDAATDSADARTQGSQADAAIDAPEAGDARADAALLCPTSHPSGTDGCCGNWACVKEVCANCSDCTQAGCSATQTCCPQYSGGGKYKGVSCSALPCQ